MLEEAHERTMNTVAPFGQLKDLCRRRLNDVEGKGTMVVAVVINDGECTYALTLKLLPCGASLGKCCLVC